MTTMAVMALLVAGTSVASADPAIDGENNPNDTGDALNEMRAGRIQEVKDSDPTNSSPSQPEEENSSISKRVRDAISSGFADSRPDAH